MPAIRTGPPCSPRSLPLAATQADGSVQNYAGTYTVMNGQIVRSDIHRIS